MHDVNMGQKGVKGGVRRGGSRVSVSGGKGGKSGKRRWRAAVVVAVVVVEVT